MENIRLKQAQDLVITASKQSKTNIVFKEAQKGKIEVDEFENLFKKIIKSEEFIYTSLPSHNLSKEEAKIFTNYIIEARNSIDSILSDFKVIEKSDDKADISAISSNVLIITTKNNIKKSLKKLGIDVQRIIVANVPLKSEDIKEINPKIPESAMKGIETKAEHIHNDIKRKIATLKPEKILILAEEDINGNLLGKRAKEQYDASVFLSNEIKDLTDFELIDILTSTK